MSPADASERLTVTAAPEPPLPARPAEPRRHEGEVRGFRAADGLRVFVLVSLVIGLLLAAAPAPLAAGADSAGPLDLGRIDAYLRAQRGRHSFPGVAVGVVEGDRIVHLAAFGAGITPQTPLVLASVSKPLTATAVMQLVDGGSIDLDAPVVTYLPEFRVADALASRRITVRQLLNHTSGLPPSACEIEAPTIERFVASLRDVRLDRPVGSRYEYCSGNYIVLGMVVQRVSGLSYAAYMERRVFSPLDMTRSHATVSGAVGDGVGHGHHWLFGATVTDDFFNPSGAPAGYLVSSAENMCHFLLAHLNAGRYGTASVLTDRAVNLMHAPSVDMGGGQSYGLGWVTGDQGGVPAVYHYGTNYNVETFVVLEPQTGRGAVLLVNTQGLLAASAVRNVEEGLSRLLDGREPPSPAASVHLVYLVADTLFLLLLAALVVPLARLRRWRRSPDRLRHRRRAWARAVVECGGGLLIVGGLRFVFVQLGANWFEMLRSAPDVVPAILLLGVLLASGGVARSVLLLRGPAPGATSSIEPGRSA